MHRFAYSLSLPWGQGETLEHAPFSNNEKSNNVCAIFLLEEAIRNSAPEGFLMGDGHSGTLCLHGGTKFQTSRRKVGVQHKQKLFTQLRHSKPPLLDTEDQEHPQNPSS